MALVRWCELPRDVDRMKSLLESTKAQIDLAAKWAIISAASCIALVLLLLVLGHMDQRFYLAATIGKLRFKHTVKVVTTKRSQRLTQNLSKDCMVCVEK